MKFGLEENIIDSLISIFEQHAKVDNAFMFGSRAKGNYRPDSDIDIAIKAWDIDTDDIIAMGIAFEEKGISYKIDLINYDTIKEPALKDHIDRVGIELYKRWKEIPLSETTKFIVDNRGKTVPTSENGIPLIATNCIDNNNLYPIYKNVRYISQHTYDTWFRAHPEPDDIILTLKGSQNGAVCLVPDPIDFAIAQDMVALRVNEKIIDSKFLFAVLRSPQIQYDIKNFDVSGVIPHFKKSDFDKLMLPYPDMETQKTIGSIYMSLSNKIDLLNRQNKTLEHLAETIFRQWFVEEVEDSWEATTFDQHLEVFRGLSYKGSGLTEFNLGLPMHNLNSVYEGGGYKYEGIKFYKGDYKDRHIVNAGDIIVTNTEQGHEYKLIGFPAIVPTYYGEKGLFSQHIYKIVPLTETYLSREFFYYLLLTPFVREQIIAATNGSTVNMLSIDGLQMPTFRTPPKEKVLKFSSIAKEYWAKKDANQKQIRTLTQTRDSLLPKLMSGEVKVSTETISN